jgi:GntR family transcriptional regulator, carbon starvation induced regulator
MKSTPSLVATEAQDSRLSSTKTLIEHVYNGLKADIIQGRLRPDAKLPIEQLRARHGVSSSTLREALTLLVADALVTAEGQRGFKVAPASMADFREIIDLRKMMETTALRQSIELGDDNWEGRIVAAFHKLSLIDTRRMQKSEAVAREWSERNEAFHEALVSASTLKWVRHFRRILYHSSERYLALSLAMLNVRVGVRREHKAIMDAALARNADLACRLAAEHIERTYVALANVAPKPLRRN